MADCFSLFGHHFQNVVALCRGQQNLVVNKERSGVGRRFAPVSFPSRSIRFNDVDGNGAFDYRREALC
jgi:hypothetical protein